MPSPPVRTMPAAVYPVAPVPSRALGYFSSAGIDLTTSHAFADIIGAALPTGTMAVLVTAESAAIRWRDDAVAPTASLGVPLAAGDSVWFDQVDLTKVALIGAGAVVHLCCYGG